MGSASEKVEDGSYLQLLTANVNLPIDATNIAIESKNVTYVEKGWPK